MKHFLFLLISLVVIHFTVEGQESKLQVVSTAGHTFKNATYQLDWSIGEVLTETFLGGEIKLTQGFHQGALEINTLVDNSMLNISIKAYPNPTSSLLNLLVETDSFSSMEVIVTDISGRVLVSKTIYDSITQLDFSNYTSGTYIVLVRSQGQLQKSFRILKN